MLSLHKLCFFGSLLYFVLKQGTNGCPIVKVLYQPDNIPWGFNKNCNISIEVKLFSFQDIRIVDEIVVELKRFMQTDNYKPEDLCNVDMDDTQLEKQISATSANTYFVDGIWQTVCGPAPLYLNIIKERGLAKTEFILLEIRQFEMRHHLLLVRTTTMETEVYDYIPSNIVSFMNWCNIHPNLQETWCRKRNKPIRKLNRNVNITASLREWAGKNWFLALRIVEDTWVEHGDCPLDQLRIAFERNWNASWQFVCGRPEVTVSVGAHMFSDSEPEADDFILINVNLVSYGTSRTKFNLMVYRMTPIVKILPNEFNDKPKFPFELESNSVHSQEFDVAEETFAMRK